ncbi:early nodulin-like protein 1 [Coffea eugenioides]|uniref:Early nodulin-like protein 15 n=1 Tax=Coffea arabica TaxID=13443 RepID=A0ABM4VD09_COFAR|nr:early nodulin-like protein 1 [Coffea eugenioides]
MASSSSTILVGSCLLCFFFFSFSEADRDLLVGGKPDSWKIPSSKSDHLNNWSQKARFVIGDSLVWNYDGTKDSVLLVNKKDYVTCNTSSPIEAHNDGNTKIKLDHSGPYYFISGAQGHCEKGQKLLVVVISERHTRIFISPAPSPAEEFLQGPAVAPTSSASRFKGSLFMVALGAVLFWGMF